MKAKGFIHYKNYGMELLFKSISAHYLFFNKVGLKEINSSLDKINLDNYKQKSWEAMPEDKLYLLPDFLYDEHTLLGKEIKESPHYGLMNALNNKEEFMNLEYIKRSKKGTIDMRRALNYKTNFYQEMYRMRRAEISGNQIKPILLTKVNDIYYILDGKHRAALLKVLNKSCPCIYLENFNIKQYYAAYWKKIQSQNTNRFKKHMAFYSQL